MRLLLLLIIFIGSLSAYHKNPTIGTLRLRQEWGQLPEDLSEYEVFLAVPNCGLIGYEATLQIGEESFAGVVFDCAGEWSHWWMLENGIAAEVDWWFWLQHPHLIGTEIEATITIDQHWSKE